MTARPRARRRPLTPHERRLTLIILGVVLVPVLVLLIAFALGGSGHSTSPQQQLNAQMAVTYHTYQQHVAGGAAALAQTDLTVLRSDCEQGRAIGLGQDQASSAIRGTCAAIGDPLP